MKISKSSLAKEEKGGERDPYCHIKSCGDNHKKKVRIDSQRSEKEGQFSFSFATMTRSR